MREEEDSTARTTPHQDIIPPHSLTFTTSLAVEMTGKSLATTTPNLPWKTRLSVAAYTLAVDAACRPNGTLRRFFMNLVDYKVPPSPKPSRGVSTTDITVDPSRNLWFRLYLPSDPPSAAGKLPVIFYFHGGGFAFFAPDSKPYDEFCRRLARDLPAIIISVNYRLTPEHRYPAQYDDGLDVLKFVDGGGGDHVLDGGDPARCFLAGDSAGGNLAHHVAHRAGDHEFHRLRLVGLVALQPFFGGEEITESEIRVARAPLSSSERAHWMWRAFLPEGSNRDHPAANVFGPREEEISPARFPAAAMVVVGGFDALQDWQKRYYEGLKRIGIEAKLVEYPNATHGFYGFPEMPEASMVVSEIKELVQKNPAN